MFNSAVDGYREMPRVLGEKFPPSPLFRHVLDRALAETR